MGIGENLLVSYTSYGLHLARKYARISICPGHHLFRKANSFPRAGERSSRELWGTDNVQVKVSNIFSRQIEAILFIILQIFLATRAILKIGECYTLVPRETVSFVFPRVLMGNIRTRGKTKLTSFPRDRTLSVLLLFRWFTFNSFIGIWLFD